MLLRNIGATTGRILYLLGSSNRMTPTVPFSLRLYYKTLVYEALGCGAMTSARPRRRSIQAGPVEAYRILV